MFRIISHRGNINGSNPKKENEPNYLSEAISKYRFDIEVDLWFFNNNLLLGHDFPQYKIDYAWLIERQHYVWVHCKNILAFVYLTEQSAKFKYFMNDKDPHAAVLGIHELEPNYIWTNISESIVLSSICVLPEKSVIKWDWFMSSGVCTDSPSFYKTEYLKYLNQSGFDKNSNISVPKKENVLNSNQRRIFLTNYSK